MPSFKTKKGRLDPQHCEHVRAKIANSHLLNRLIGLVNGTVEMPPHAVTAAVALLRKVVPDLSATEITGGTVQYVVRAPDVAKDAASWEQSVAVSPPLAPVQETKH